MNVTVTHVLNSYSFNYISILLTHLSVEPVPTHQNNPPPKKINKQTQKQQRGDLFLPIKSPPPCLRFPSIRFHGNAACIAPRAPAGVFAHKPFPSLSVFLHLYCPLHNSHAIISEHFSSSSVFKSNLLAAVNLKVCFLFQIAASTFSHIHTHTFILFVSPAFLRRPHFSSLSGSAVHLWHLSVFITLTLIKVHPI